jgi:hypothetical protein
MEPIEPGEAYTVAAPPIVPGELGKMAATWPLTLGIISIVMGALGILRHGCGLIQSLFMSVAMGAMSSVKQGPGAPPTDPLLMQKVVGWQIAQGAIAIVALGLAVWLLVAGIALLMRRRAGVWSHRLWAWVRIGVAVLEGGAAAGVQLMMMNQAMAFGQAQGSPPPPPGATAGVQTALMLTGVMWGVALLLVGAAYPIVVLALLSRRSARAEVARWTQ